MDNHARVMDLAAVLSADQVRMVRSAAWQQCQQAQLDATAAEKDAVWLKHQGLAEEDVAAEWAKCSAHKATAAQWYAIFRALPDPAEAATPA